MKLEYLKQFIAISRHGTLTKASEALNISQSTLTRNMYALEQLLGVSLFSRTPNALKLNKTGLYALPKFQKILDLHYDMISSIQAFDKGITIVKAGTCSQGPSWKLKQLCKVLEAPIKLELELSADENYLVKGLERGKFNFIVTSFPIKKSKVESKFFFSEQLYLSVPKDHKLYDIEKINFSNLDGETLLLRTDLGIWQELVDSLTEVSFIVQNRDTFDELVEKLSLPSFTTNISQQYKLGDIRRNIPIDDDSARKDYYISYLNKNTDKLSFISSSFIS